MKKILFTLIGLGISTLLTLLMLEIALRFFPVQSYIPIAPVTIDEPIVRYKPHVEQVYSAGWDFDAFNTGRTNGQGYIADYDFERTSDKKLIAVIGDSYIEARMVPFKDTVQERLRRLLDDRFRVYGVGIGGAPLSQYLAFAAMMRDTYKPAFLVVNIVGNDFDESLPQYKNLPRFHYFFPVGSGGMRPLLIAQYIPSPVKEFLSNSALVRYAYFHLNLANAVNKVMFWKRNNPPAADAAQDAAEEEQAPDPEALRLRDSMLATEQFLNLLTYYSGLPKSRIVLVVDGMRGEIYDGTDDSAAAKESYFGRMRDFLIVQGRAQGYEVVDLHPAFAADYAKNGNRFDFPRDYHWNAAAHGVAAGQIRQSKNLRAYLRQNPPPRAAAP